MNTGIIVEPQSDDTPHNAHAIVDTLTQHPTPEPSTKCPTSIVTGPNPCLVLNE